MLRPRYREAWPNSYSLPLSCAVIPDKSYCNCRLLEYGDSSKDRLEVEFDILQNSFFSFMQDFSFVFYLCSSSIYFQCCYSLSAVPNPRVRRQELYSLDRVKNSRAGVFKQSVGELVRCTVLCSFQNLGGNKCLCYSQPF
jgi:hypothetical protein